MLVTKAGVFGTVFAFGLVVGGLSMLAMQPHPLTAGVDNTNGQKFEKLQQELNLLKEQQNTLRSQVNQTNSLLSGFSRTSDGSLRIADKTRMVELLVECPADADAANPGFKVCGPAVFESSRMDASQVVLNGNGSFDPAVLVMLPDLPMPRSAAIETIGGEVQFMNSRVSISADDTMEGEDPLLQVIGGNWNSPGENPLVAIRGGNLNVNNGPDHGSTRLGAGTMQVRDPSGAQAFVSAANGYAKIELLVLPTNPVAMAILSAGQSGATMNLNGQLQVDSVRADEIVVKEFTDLDGDPIGGGDYQGDVGYVPPTP